MQFDDMASQKYSNNHVELDLSITEEHSPQAVKIEDVLIKQPSISQAFPELRKITLRSLITGVFLILAGAGYFILGLFSVADDPHNAGFGHATTTVVGLLVIGAGSICVFMKFRLTNVYSWDDLIKHTWFYIVFGCIILACSVYALAMLIYLLVGYIKEVDSGHLVQVPDRTKAAIGCVNALVIMVLSCFMLSCSVSIRKLVKDNDIPH